MKDMNLCRLTGTIFWSKLDDRQTFTLLRLGIKLGNGSSTFVTVNNPDVQAYDLIKPGNKVLLTNGFLDIWEKEDGTSEEQIKANAHAIQFFTKEKALSDMNSVIVVGKVVSFKEDTVMVEMTGERNPKTDKPVLRKTNIKIGDSYKNIVIGSKISLDAKVASVDIAGKSKLVIEADYDKINIL